MSREYSEISSYVQLPDAGEIAKALTAVFATEGMKPVVTTSKRPQYLGVDLRNQCQIEILSGAYGWSLLRAKPWDLLHACARGQTRPRFAALCHALKVKGFVVCLLDSGYHGGRVLLEADAQGNSTASGWWSESYDTSSDASTTQQPNNVFYGQSLRSVKDDVPFAPLDPELKCIVQDSIGTEKNSFLGDSDAERFCHYVAAFLLGDEVERDAENWSQQAATVLRFEWADDQRHEPPSSPTLAESPDNLANPMRYVDGSEVRIGDALLFDEGLFPAQATNFFYMVGQPGPFLVVLNDGGVFSPFRSLPRLRGEWPMQLYRYGDRTRSASLIAKHARLVCRDSTDYAGDGLRYLKRIAASGDVQAQFALGNAYATATGVPYDAELARAWLQKAAKNGHAGAAGLDSRISIGLHGGVFKDDNHQAESLYGAARKGLVDAQSTLAQLHDQRREYRFAVEWYERAAAGGDTLAINNLADKYEHGKGVEKDEVKAFELYWSVRRQVIAAGYSLAFFYRDGRVVPQDREMAIRYLSIAHHYGWPDAHVELQAMGAQCLSLEEAENGLRVASPTQIAQGYKFLEQPDAVPTAVILGTAQNLNPGRTSKDSELQKLAFRLYSVAAERGDREAQLQVSLAYKDGIGVERDLAKWGFWYQQCHQPK